MERSQCRGGGANQILRETNTCISDGSGKNALHSRGMLGNFIFEIEWQLYKWLHTWYL